MSFVQHPPVTTPSSSATGRLRGRDDELARLTALVRQARAGQSGALVVSGAPGVGKTALLDQVAEQLPPTVRVQRVVASESEIELAYAGLQLLCRDMMTLSDRLPVPQRESLEAAFGLRESGAPNPFVVGLATLGLLTEAAADGPVLCIADDAQWLDPVSAGTLAFVARRLSAEGIALVLVMREVSEQFTDLPQQVLAGLGDDDARELLKLALPGAIDERVRDQLIREARGNPLALQELPRALSPTELAGGFALARSMPVQSRIEQGLLARLDPLPEAARTLLLLAAADPTGDRALLQRASALLGLKPEDLDAALQADALTVGTRVEFRHPLVRSTVYRAASPTQRRVVHAALADATDADRDPDRRAWHRASATVLPDERVAADLEQSAERARTRGGVAAAAAFLVRAAELSAESSHRADRLIAAAEAQHDAGAPAAVLHLLDSTRDQALTTLQQALIGRLRARAEYALRRDRSAPLQLLAAAQDLEPLDRALARDTYMEAMVAAMYAGRLGEPGAVTQVAEAILEATENDHSGRAQDLMLRGQALLCARGQTAALPTVRRALEAFQEQPLDALELHWMWLAGHAAQDLWDAEAMRTLTERQVQRARASGALGVLPMALSLQMVVRTFDGSLEAAESVCDELDVILSVTGHPLPKYGRIFLAAYRGQLDEVELRARELRADAHARGEGYALTVANFAEALAYNAAGRYHEALASARGELPYADELGHAMRTLLEVVEAAARTGDGALAEESVEHMIRVTRPVGENDWALAFVALAQAQLQDGEQAEVLYREAIERFIRVRVPILVARSRLLYGEMLRRQNRRVDAREQLRVAYQGFVDCGMLGFAERAQRELQTAGESVRMPTAATVEQLTDQELNVARLARDGLTNRDIGSQLFISGRTAEYHLRKVFVKLGITSRSELRAALADIG